MDTQIQEKTQTVFDVETLPQQFYKLNKDLFKFKNSTTPTQIFIYDTVYLSQNEIISSNFSDLLDIPGIHGVFSGTGNGKTKLVSYTFKQRANPSEILTKKSIKNLDTVYLLTVPSRSQCEQNHSNLEYELTAFIGGIKVENLLKNNFQRLSMVYDKAEEIIKNIGTMFKDKKLVLVVDESHELIYANNFRRKAINDLKQLQKYCTTVIHLTATYTANLLTYKYDKISLYIPKNKVYNINNLTIYKGESQKIDDKLIKLIKEQIKKDKTVLIFLDNIKKHEELKNEFLIEYFKDDESVQLLDSDKKATELFKYISQYSCFPKKVKVVITTKMLQAGINLNIPNLCTIYYQNCNSHLNFEDILQAFARGRLPQEECFLMLKKSNREKDNNDSTKKFKTLEQIYSEQRINTEKRLMCFENIYKDLDKIIKEKNGEVGEETLKILDTVKDKFYAIETLFDSKDIDGNNYRNCLEFDKQDEKFYINEETFSSYVLRLYNNQLIKHTDKLIEILTADVKAKNIDFFVLDQEIDKKVAKKIEKIKQDKEEKKEISKEQRKKLITKIRDTATENFYTVADIVLFEAEDKFFENAKASLKTEEVKLIDEIKENTDFIDELRKIYTKIERKTKKQKNDHICYLTFEEHLKCIVNDKNIEIELMKKYNKELWANDKIILENLADNGHEYARFRIFIDEKIKKRSRLTDKLISELYDHMYLDNKKKPNKKAKKNYFIKLIHNLCKVSKDNQIYGLNK